MTQWPRDRQSELIAYYGTPGGIVERQLVKVVPPFQMFYEGRPVSALLFHKKAADALKIALDKVWNDCGRSQKKIDSLGISKTAGTYVKRKIKGSENWSNHAFGGAIDINSQENGFGRGRGTIPPVLVAAFDSVGFRWGGRYRGRTDPMHFEAVRDRDAVNVAGILDEPLSAGIDFEAHCGEAHERGCIMSDGSGSEGGQDDLQDDDGNKPGFFRRWRNRIFGGAGGIGGYGILAGLTDWQVAAVLFIGAFVLIAATVAFVIWFFGADNVRAWFRKQVR